MTRKWPGFLPGLFLLRDKMKLSPPLKQAMP
ncbi:hypothetical protein BDD14_4210 [Edaphobacter modestus]|uniref:Uncharacterized protein n=1 Tax=Edaphobacter modestus TaxID=388466 RepID=A0A4Q7YZK4_9BACT|nr:hypothetical protein BDD14_4210 [Edaphobacter modestus]